MTDQRENADIVERLTSHMGKQDVGILLRDCREAAAEITSLRKQLEEARAKALEEAATYIEQVNGSIPDRQEHAAAIRNLAGDQP